MPFTTKNADFSISDNPEYDIHEDEAFWEMLRHRHQNPMYPPPPMNNNTVPYYNYSSFGPSSYDFYRSNSNTYSPTENNHEYIERNSNKAKKTTDAADSTHPGGLNREVKTIITCIRAIPIIDPKKTTVAGPKKTATVIRRKIRIPLSPIDINVNINSDLIPEHIRRALIVEYVDNDSNVLVENRLRRCYSL